jgi:murein DD-endopeptidase MepM/ murein hydrolase activator NlpD
MKVLYFLLSLTSFAALATDIPLYYWDNQDGFKSAQHCSVSHTNDQKFRISTYSGSLDADTENLRNLQGVKQSHLMNGSLVKLVDSERKPNYKYIEVTGVNQNSNVSTSRWASERQDRGYLYYRSLLPPEDYILQLKAGTPQGAMGATFASAQDTYWRLASESYYYQLNCKEFTANRKYVVFKVYTKHSKTPSALVGVYWDETKILRSIRSYSKYDVMAFLPNTLSEEPIENLITNFSVKPANSTTVTNTVEEEHDVIPTIVNSSDLDEETIRGGMQDIVCISNNILNVRDESLNVRLFSANPGEKVKRFQGWGTNTQDKIIGGISYNFIKVQFPNREASDQTIGWVAQRFVKAKSKCPYVNGNIIVRDSNAVITDLDDPNCCEFPTVKKVTHRFNEGMRKFKAGRGGGTRLHAACDLYRHKDEPILSVAPGTVLRNAYYFYQGTYALEVKHSGGFVVRYGEITGKTATGVSSGKTLKMGQRIGYMGKVNSNCCRPMLHFELFSGTETGALSTSGNKFKRRSDLLDPTKYLLKWESERF